ncbi:MAG: SRPBCC family protein [Marinosulfonomonas sp.]|nr:SRPBCC family protein [Marinosulfonomonas sp.]
MKFSTRQDINAPVEFVFERATDFGSFERQAMRRGVEIERVDENDENCVGMQWSAKIPFRGKLRRVRAELTEYDAPHRLFFQSVSGGVEANMEVELLPLSRQRTRIRLGLTLLPRTLPARLLVQSLKFAKNNLDDKFAKRVISFGRDVEDRHAGKRNINT